MAGATVFITGRSRRGGKTTDNLTGTIDETAELVTKNGGRGIPCVCDHTSDTDVEGLAGTIREKFGKLDILVNNAWGGYEQYDPKLFELPLWEQTIWRWDKMFQTGPRAHYTTIRFLSPLLI